MVVSLITCQYFGKMIVVILKDAQFNEQLEGLVKGQLMSTGGTGIITGTFSSTTTSTTVSKLFHLSRVFTPQPLRLSASCLSDAAEAT